MHRRELATTLGPQSNFRKLVQIWSTIGPRNRIADSFLFEKAKNSINHGRTDAKTAFDQCAGNAISTRPEAMLATASVTVFE